MWYLREHFKDEDEDDYENGEEEKWIDLSIQQNNIGWIFLMSVMKLESALTLFTTIIRFPIWFL